MAKINAVVETSATSDNNGTVGTNDLEQQLQSLMSGSTGGGDEMDFLSNLDMTSVQSLGNMTLLPMYHPNTEDPIQYEWEIVDASMQVAKESGNRMVVIRVKSTWPLQHKGVTVFDNLVLTENALWRFKSLCEACDLLNDAGNFSGKSLNDFKGNIVRNTIVHNQYKGSMRNKMGPSYTEGYETPGLKPDPAQIAELPGAGPSWEPAA